MPGASTGDIEALRTLAARYAAGVDGRRRELLLAAFHTDGELVVHRTPAAGGEPVELRGHAELARVVDVIARYEATFHLVGQGLYEVDGDFAWGEVACLAHHYRRSADGCSDRVVHIRYHDRYRRGEDGSWRIERREVRPTWAETRQIEAS